MIMSIAGILDFGSWSSDVKQAYLQYTNTFDHALYITNILREFYLDPKECWLILRPLYGLCDSGDLLSETMDEIFQNDVRLRLTRLDPTLYAFNPGKDLKGSV